MLPHGRVEKHQPSARDRFGDDAEACRHRPAAVSLGHQTRSAGLDPGDFSRAKRGVVYRCACSERSFTATRRGVAVSDYEKARRSAAGGGWLNRSLRFREKRTTAPSTQLDITSRHRQARWSRVATVLACVDSQVLPQIHRRVGWDREAARAQSVATGFDVPDRSPG